MSNDSRTLKYVKLTDEEVEELIMARLKEIRKLLEEIVKELKEAGGLA